MGQLWCASYASSLFGKQPLVLIMQLVCTKITLRPNYIISQGPSNKRAESALNKVRVGNQLHINYIIIHQYLNFNIGFSKPPLTLRNGWIINKHKKQWLKLFIYALISVWYLMWKGLLSVFWRWFYIHFHRLADILKLLTNEDEPRVSDDNRWVQLWVKWLIFSGSVFFTQKYAYSQWKCNWRTSVILLRGFGISMETQPKYLIELFPSTLLTGIIMIITRQTALEQPPINHWCQQIVLNTVYPVYWTYV